MEKTRDEYIGGEAMDFVEKYLRKIETNSDTWETTFVHKETGEIWIMDYPNSEHHGGGIPRLRKLK